MGGKGVKSLNFFELKAISPFPFHSALSNCYFLYFCNLPIILVVRCINFLLFLCLNVSYSGILFHGRIGTLSCNLLPCHLRWRAGLSLFPMSLPWPSLFMSRPTRRFGFRKRFLFMVSVSYSERPYLYNYGMWPNLRKILQSRRIRAETLFDVLQNLFSLPEIFPWWVVQILETLSLRIANFISFSLSIILFYWINGLFLIFTRTALFSSQWTKPWYWSNFHLHFYYTWIGLILRENHSFS